MKERLSNNAGSFSFEFRERYISYYERSDNYVRL
nr:MAG TPA: hypothetical protein [Caudoviricetes sp.]